LILKHLHDPMAFDLCCLPTALDLFSWPSCISNAANILRPGGWAPFDSCRVLNFACLDLIKFSSGAGILWDKMFRHNSLEWKRS
jgi:hypothetical protein